MKCSRHVLSKEGLAYPQVTEGAGRGTCGWHRARLSISKKDATISES